MSELQLTIEEKSTFMDTLARWVPRIAIALLFLALGASTFGSDGVWVRLFEQIGFGQWFRVFTGASSTKRALIVQLVHAAGHEA